MRGLIILEILLVLLAYLIGSIPFALLIGKIFYNVDVRTVGSGNLGSTNVFRNLGKKAGVAVLLLDVLKGAIVTALPIFISSSIHPLFLGLFAVIGHSFSIFAQFKGGKSVATAAGMILIYNPITMVLGVLIFLLSLKMFKFVSLSSMIASLIVFTSSFTTHDTIFISIMGLVSLFIIYRHRSNWKRIKKGIEPKVSWI